MYNYILYITVYIHIMCVYIYSYVHFLIDRWISCPIASISVENPNAISKNKFYFL